MSAQDPSTRNRPRTRPRRQSSWRFAAVAGEGAGWAAVGLTTSLLLGVLLEPVRGRVGLENVAICYLGIVAVCAAIGGRTAGLWTAVSAALSYNFFFTTPYRTLRIDNAEQVVTVLLLLATGLLAAAAGRSTRRIEARESQETDAIHLLTLLAGTTAGGGDPDRQAAAGVLDLLGARRVQVRRGNAVTADVGEDTGPLGVAPMPRLDPYGHIPSPRRTGVGRASMVRWSSPWLPADGFVVPLVRAGREAGALVVLPGAGDRTSVTVRVALTGIAGVLALADPARLSPSTGPTILDGDER
jgi:hypothetical protein